MNRIQFMASNMDLHDPLGIGSLRPQDAIKSKDGLVAVVIEERPGYYVVKITDGRPFEHKEEVRFNHSLERYEIDATRISKWKRKD